MPNGTTRLIDHDPRRGSRCVAVIGTGAGVEAWLDRFVAHHAEFGAMPVVLHLIDRARGDDATAPAAAARLASGSRIMLHPTFVTGVRDQSGGTQRIDLGDGSDMTVDVVLDVLDADTPAGDEPGRSEHARRFELAAAPAEGDIDRAARSVLEALRTRNDAAVCLAEIGPDVSVFDGVVLV